MTFGAVEEEPAEDQGATLDGFANLLADADPDVFKSARNVRAFFDIVDKHFTMGETTMRLGSPCTKSASTTCWAARVQPAWNHLFNKRGVEMIQLHRGSYHFRTLNVSPEKLDATYDVKFLCLYLWLLRQHRCISGVVFSLSVVAPRHGPLFMSLLQLTPCVQKFEMRISDSFRESSAQSWLNALSGLSQLRELSLCNMRLSDSDVTVLARIVERSEFLVTLILIDVDVGSVAFRKLTTKVGQNDTLKGLRIKTTVKKLTKTFTEGLSEIGKSRLVRLYVHLNDGLCHLLQGFKNSLLTELALEPMIHDCEVLAVLANFLKREKSVQHLKVCLDTTKMDTVPGALDNMARIISESSLILLVLSGSKLTSESARRLANALGESGKVLELHLEECDLMLDDMRPFVDAVKTRSDMNEFVLLNLGVLQGERQQKRDLVSHIKEHNLLEQILLVYDDDVGSILPESLEEGLKFVHVFLSFATLEVSVESVLHALTYAPWNLESISIISDQVVGGSAGQSLRYIIENVHSLKVLKILCVLLPVTAGEVCDALANSQSLVTLAIGDWIFDPAAKAKFVQMLGINRSLCRLEFHCTDNKDCSSRRELLDRALCRSLTVWIAEVYCGQELQELDIPGSGPHHVAQANEMAISWTADLILGRGHCDAGSGLFDVLDVCEAPLDLFKRANYFVPRPRGNQALVPYMATRSMFYALFSAFFGVKEFVYCSTAMASFRRLLGIKRREAWRCVGLAPLPAYEEVVDGDLREEDLLNFDVVV